MDNQEYMVSVRLMTYNHAQFIDEAIKGILEQQVNFKVEVVVGDDFSTDNTLEIIKGYKDTKHISIKILKREIGDDYWQKRQKYGRLYNFSNIIENCKGKYIALLDGDDYWTDPLKLQKQVDLLEANNNVVACFTNAILKNEITNEQKHYILKLKGGVLPPETVIVKGGSLFPTASLVFRRDKWNYTNFSAVEGLPGDVILIYNLLACGDIYFLNIVTCVYRRWSGGIYSSISSDKARIAKKYIHELKGYYEFDRLSNYKYHKFLKRKISILCLNIYDGFPISQSYKILHKIHFKHWGIYFKKKIKSALKKASVYG